MVGQRQAAPNRHLRPLLRSGGEGGIRTLDGLPHTPLAGERLQPLGHLSRRGKIPRISVSGEKPAKAVYRATGCRVTPNRCKHPCTDLAEASTPMRKQRRRLRSVLGRSGGARVHARNCPRRLTPWSRKWRRGRDSNPRGACTPGGFQDRCLQPLGHLSRAGSVDLRARIGSDGPRDFGFHTAAWTRLAAALS